MNQKLGFPGASESEREHVVAFARRKRDCPLRTPGRSWSGRGPDGSDGSVRAMQAVRAAGSWALRACSRPRAPG